MTDQQTDPANPDDVELLRQAASAFNQIVDQIGKVIVGQRDIVRTLVAAMFCEGHVLVIGVPGLAKTLLVRTLAQVLGWQYRRIQFTPDMMPADIIGMELLHEESPGTGRSMKFLPGPIFANIVLADEINRTPPKTQSALLEAMQEYTVTSMGCTHRLDKPFVVVATQNPIEQEGTYPLPEAQLDRFMFSLWVDYPAVEEEEQIVTAGAGGELELQPVMTAERMIGYQQLVRRLPVGRHVVSHAVAITRATRPTDPTASQFVRQYVEWGAGPRAAQHLVTAGKALAVIDGVPAVSVDHIRQIAPAVLRHRVLPNYQAAGDQVNSAAVIEHVLEQVG